MSVVPGESVLKQLGIPLFIRTTRSLRLTHEGEGSRERAMRLLHEAEEMQQAAISTRNGPSGIIRVAAPYPIGVHVLAPALVLFRARHPALAVDLRIRDQMADLVAEGIDIAIRVGDLPNSRLISRHLAPHRICAFAAPAYLARKGTPTRPEELDRHDCVKFRFQSSGQALRWPFSVDGELVEIAPDAGIVADVRIARFIAQLPLAAETMEPAQIRFLPPLSQPGVIYGGRGELPRPCRGHGKGLQYGPDDRSEGRWRIAVALHQGRPGDTVRPPPGAALSLAHANARLGG